MAGSRAVARPRRVDPWYVAALVTGIGALAVYRATMLPGLASWDTAEAQTVVSIGGTMHPTGFPAYVVLGWIATRVLAPLGSPAFVANLWSAVLVATAVGTTVLVARRLGASIPIAVAVAAGFALTPLVWSLALAADVHALHLLLLVVIVGLLLRWESFVGASLEEPDDARLRARADRALVLAAAVFGLAIANHGLALLLVPAVGLYVLAVEPGVVHRPRLVAAALGACIGVAAVLYLELPLRAGPFRAPLVYGHPETWAGFWDIALGRQFQGDMIARLADLPGTVTTLLSQANRQLGPIVVLVPVALLATALRRPRYALLSGVAAGMTCLFAAAYDNAAIDRYYAGPAFFTWTWLGVLAVEAARVVGGVGARAPVEADAGDAVTRDDAPSRRTALATTLLAGAIVGLALIVPTAMALSARWGAVDRSGQDWAHAWLDQAFADMEPNAVVVSWWSYSTPLWYGQLVEGRRPDIRIVDDRTLLDEHLGEVGDVIEANLDSRPVYLIRVQQSELQTLTDRYRIEPVGLPGNLLRVTGRKETSP